MKYPHHSTRLATLNDQPQREQALNINKSFIVQAPAGSGKTTLLVQRYLALLSKVNYPEEIIAITFTRKAASEMRHRIINALNDAAAASSNQSNEDKLNLKQTELTMQVLQQSAKHNWQLQNFPHRLRVQTIDSLCYSLVSCAPLISGLGTAPNIADSQRIEQYYIAAVQSLLKELDSPEFDEKSHLANILLHLDNDLERFTSLSVDMLKKREQWLPYVVNIKQHNLAALRNILENGLTNVIQEAIEKCQQKFPQDLFDEAIMLADFAASNLNKHSNENQLDEGYILPANRFSGLAQIDPSSLGIPRGGEERATFVPGFIHDCRERRSQQSGTNLLGANLSRERSDPDLATRGAEHGQRSIKPKCEGYIWQNLAQLLLTKEGTWRKQVTVKDGFPPAKTKGSKNNPLNQEMKDRLIALIEKLKKIDGLLFYLFEMQTLPVPQYTDAEWEILCALLELLPLLVAELEIIFQENGMVDYTAISLAAERALSFDNETPTDLALNLDYKIKHILVDEFQDISLAQYRLLEKLTLGWEEHDGRTLFLVGDPMQSIYRFRQADVGLFLRAEKEGIGNIKLEKLQLTSNFRSAPNIVEWINHNFAKILPQISDITSGSVTFCPAYAATTKQQDIKGDVKVHILTSTASPIENNNDSDSDNEIIQLKEAKYVTSLIENIAAKQTQQTNDTQNSIAILVSARSHLNHLIPALKEANIPYHAVELESLKSSMAIQDLLSLTRALTNISDRIAWLSILRAPWCGLCLNDLHVIANAKHDGCGCTIWDNLCAYQKLDALSTTGKKIIAKFLPIMQQNLYNRGRQNLRVWIENTWLMLGGPASVQDANELENAEQFFQLLEMDDSGSYDVNIELLTNKLENLYSNQTDAIAPLQIMTIHKAKGLEFDHVIVCGLNKDTRGDNKDLLMWLERPRPHGGNDLLLAPLKAFGGKENATYDYLRNLDKQKDYNENGRLLYVAATRAKKSLHLVANVKYADEKTDDDKNKKEIEDTQPTQSSIKPFLKIPKEKTLLHQLWQCFEDSWLKDVAKIEVTKDSKDSEEQNKEKESENNGPIITRLSPDWQSPFSPLETENVIPKKSHYRYYLPHETEARLGTVIHKCLQQLAQNFHLFQMQKQNPHDYCRMQQDYWRKLLVQAGLFDDNDMDEYLETISNSIINTLSDKKGLWLLDTKHQDAHNEYAITAIIDDTPKNLIIDRTFIDENNRRWIIDYKTSMPDKSQKNLDDFIAQQQSLYKPQLEQYAEAFKNNKDENKRDIMLGIYFPLCKGWCEWGAEDRGQRTEDRRQRTAHLP